MHLLEEQVMAIKKKKSGSTKASVKKNKNTSVRMSKENKKSKSALSKKVKKAQPKKKVQVVKDKVKKSVKKAVATKKKSVIVKKAPKKTPVKKIMPVKKVEPVKKNSKRKATNVMTVRMISEEKKVPQSVHTPSSKKATTLLGALEFTPYQAKDNEGYMNDHQKDHFRKILDAWKQQLMQDVDLTVGHLKEEAVFYADPVDRASQEEGFNLELRTRDRERRLIKKIEQSLDLLNTGEYGFCEDCGAEIGVRRLEARPTAVKCIDCKTFQEIREKQLGG